MQAGGADLMGSYSVYAGVGAFSESTVELAALLERLPSKLPPPGAAEQSQLGANCIPTFADLGKSDLPSRQQNEYALQHTPRKGSGRASPIRGGVGHIPPFAGVGPAGEATVELAKMLVNMPPKTAPPGAAKGVEYAPTFSDLEPCGESTVDLCQLLAAAKQVPYKGKVEVLPEKTEDLSNLLKSAATKGLSSASTPQQRPVVKPFSKSFLHSTSSSSAASGGTGPQLTDKFMENLEQYVENSRREADKDDQEQIQEEEHSGSSVAQPCQQACGRSSAWENALHYVAVGREAAEPHLAAACLLLGRGRQAAREFFYLSNRNASPAGRLFWIFTRLMLVVILMILFLFVAVEVNYRLGPEPEEFL